MEPLSPCKMVVVRPYTLAITERARQHPAEAGQTGLTTF